MKLDESILDQFDLNPNDDREPVNVMRVSELLAFLEESASRIVSKSELFFKTDDADRQADCLDIVAMRLNDFVQAFIDIVIYIRKAEGSYNGKSNSLRYCVTSYDTLIKRQSHMEKQFLGEILLRNEITHDYFNREIHQKKLIALMQNCSGGAGEVYEQLATLCKQRGLTDKYVDKNS
ncbi:MAG: hypothetical protein E7308_06325 [Butyrivibrio sp.]|nr:hypothetical protein [Butyrivibrio sp.]MBE5823670.1 hypothetical protein [Butyrivibrio sp.]MBR1641516.1 hypothetical protein [Butyrivibrio sp.]